MNLQNLIQDPMLSHKEKKEIGNTFRFVLSCLSYCIFCSRFL